MCVSSIHINQPSSQPIRSLMVLAYESRKEESVLLSANSLGVFPTLLLRQLPFLRVPHYMRDLAMLINANHTIGTDIQVIEIFAMNEWADIDGLL